MLEQVSIKAKVEWKFLQMMDSYDATTKQRSTLSYADRIGNTASYGAFIAFFLDLDLLEWIDHA